MPHYNTQSLCIRCKHLRPALDPNLQKAYLGQCLKREWPFTLSITLEGWTECEVFEDSGKVYAPPDPALAKVAAAAAAAKGPKRIEFYYSSAQKPGEAFPCDIPRALELIKKLQAQGIDAKAIDVAGMKDRFPIYHKSVSGPDADRKSTRLNSSHGYISYAVFCLKKKKTTTNQTMYRSQRFQKCLLH